ncbi:PfkB family carbohydrate kinase [Streptomyces sp. NBC_01231]|nr:PfkB family carbohydrate kinase [Streptomyces sp. NBC_01231]
MTLVGIHAGLSVDHLVSEPAGVRFSCPGGPALFAALGARLVTGTDVRVNCPLPEDDPRFARIFDECGVDRRHCRRVSTVPRLWILNSARGRRIITQDPTSGTELEEHRPELDEHRPELEDHGPGREERRPELGQHGPGREEYRPELEDHGPGREEYRPELERHRPEREERPPESEEHTPAGEENPLPSPAAGFHVGLDGLVASSPAERPTADPRTLVGLDPHQTLVAEQGLRYLRRVVSATTVLLPSRVQLNLLDRDPRRAARSLADGLGLPVIARLDAEGCYVVTADGNWSVRDRAVTVVETTGAGDAGAAAVVAALAAGADPVEAAMFGTSVARTALAGWGHTALAAATPLSRPFPDVTTRKEN